MENGEDRREIEGALGKCGATLIHVVYYIDYTYVAFLPLRAEAELDQSIALGFFC